MDKYNMKEIIENYMNELVEKGALDLTGCNSEFDKLMKLYAIGEVPTEQVVNLLQNNNYSLTNQSLAILESEFKAKSIPMPQEDIDRIINELRSKWNIK